VKAQLYSIPPGICGITWSLGSAFLADRYNHRFTFAIIAITMAICGFAMAGWAIELPGARYAGIFLAYMGKESMFFLTSRECYSDTTTVHLALK
jgi:hypothetical protein